MRSSSLTPRVCSVFSAAILTHFLAIGGVQGQDIYTGIGQWTDVGNWSGGALPADNAQTVINGTCEVAQNIGTANTLNPARVTIGQGATGVLNVTGGTLSGAHGGGNGIFVGEGVGGDGTLFIAEGASFRSQGGNMNVRIGDELGAVGKVTVAGELLNFKFFEIVNGELEMMSTGINNKFNENNPSVIGANGTLSFVIDGAEVGTLQRANNNGLQLTIDPAADLGITLGGAFSINDSWTLISYGSLSGQFAQGTNFTNQQGYTFSIDYGSGFLDAVTLTLISDSERPKVNAFAANPPSSSAGAPVQLSWDVENFDGLSIDQGVGDVTLVGGQGTVTVNPTETTTYTLTVALEAATVTESVTVVVDALPEIASFTASPPIIAPGEDATLAWQVSGATTITISDGIGAVGAQGSQAVSPAATTTYTLTATNSTGTVTAEATVTVDAIEAALLNQFLAEAPGQSSGALLDGIGTSNFDVRNGDLRPVVDSPYTKFTMEMGRANPEATDGGDNGDGFPDGKTFELWVRAGDLGTEPQVIFDTGGSNDGVAVLINQDSVRAIQSSSGIQTGDVSVSTSQVNVDDDFIQIVVTLDSDGGMLGVSVLGAGGGGESATGAGGGIPIGRASLFSWSGFGGAIAGSLGGLGDAAVPAGTTTFLGSVALINVYGRVLDEAEIAEAFSRWTMNVPTGDSDNDMLPDFWELRYFGDLSALPGDNGDGDQLTNAQELEAGSDPTEADTDMDDLDDHEEVAAGTDPADPDSDDDLLGDGEEINGDPASNPLLADTDGDTFSDSVEVEEGSDPNVAGSVPTAFIGQAPVAVDQSLGAAPSYHTTFAGLDALDATFRLCVDFDEKADGEREVLFETGGGGIGFSLVYEAGSQLVLRSSANPLMAEVFYALTAGQIAAGELEIVFTYDVFDDNDEDGGSTISLFVDGVLVGADSDQLGGDWSGTNNSAFGVFGSGIAGILGGGDLTGVDFTSGTINLRKGLQFYSDVLFAPSNNTEVEIIAVSYDGTDLTITFTSNPGATYSVEESSDLQSWQEVIDPGSGGSTTTVSVPYDRALVPRIFLRVSEIE